MTPLEWGILALAIWFVISVPIGLLVGAILRAGAGPQ